MLAPLKPLHSLTTTTVSVSSAVAKKEQRKAKKKTYNEFYVRLDSKEGVNDCID